MPQNRTQEVKRGTKKMSAFIIDIEADGPIPGDFSMIEIGVVLLDREYKTTFHAKLRPISQTWLSEALNVTGYSRIETLEWDDPKHVMELFKKWISEVNIKGRPIFFSDNNGFDWMFTHWYFIHFLGVDSDPFGFSSRNISDIFKGINHNIRSNFKHLRKFKHTHNPVDDAKGNASALVEFIDKYNLKGFDI